MEKSKKFVVLFLTPMAMLILTVSKFKPVEEFSKEDSGLSLFGESLSYQFLIYVFLLFATLYTYYITFYLPYSKYEKLAAKRWATLDDRAKKIVEKFPEHTVNINVIVPKRKFFFRIEPHKNNPDKRKFSFFGKTFHVVWSIGEPVHKQLRLTTKQGYSGKVFNEMRRPLVTDFTNPNVSHINFTTNQEEICNDLYMLVTFPIYKRTDGMDGQEIKYLGILNVEGTSIGSEDIVKDSQKLAILSAEAIALSQLCANLLE